MKLQTCLASLLFSTAATFAQNAPLSQTIANLLPPVPAGVNSAAVAAPKLDWVQRVQATNARAQQSAATVKLVFDGDSITDGWQTRGKSVWAEHYAGLNAFDFGISGDRTQHLLWRLENGQVDNLKPTLIALMIGTNNLISHPDEQIVEGITQIVGNYRKRCPDAVILLQAIFPRGKNAADPARARIKAINEAISKLNDGKKIRFIDFGDKFLNPDGSMSPEIMHDFLHPTEQGYKIWADAIQPIIDEYFPAVGPK